MKRKKRKVKSNNLDIRVNRPRVNKAQARKIGNIVRVIALIIMLLGLVYSQNNLVFINDFTYSSSSIPKAFNGYTIVVLGDIHNKTNGVYRKVIKQKPDIVLVTGGYLDEEGNYSKSTELIDRLGKDNEVYYVLGEEDLDYKDLIIASIDNANYINENNITLMSNVTSEETFIKDNVDSQIIKEANKGNELAYMYIEYTVNKLMESFGLNVELSGLDYTDNKDNLKDKVFKLFSEDTTSFKILLYNDYFGVGEAAKADIDAIMTGNTHDKTKIDTITYNNGKAIFTTNGIGNHGTKRVFNYPNILSIKLTNKGLSDRNVLEIILDKLNGNGINYVLNDPEFKRYVEDNGGVE